MTAATPVDELELGGGRVVRLGDTLTVTSDTKLLDDVEKRACGVLRDRSKAVYVGERGTVVGITTNVLGVGDGVDLRFVDGATRFYFLQCIEDFSSKTSSGAATTARPKPRTAVHTTSTHVDPATMSAPAPLAGSGDEERAADAPAFISAPPQLPAARPGRAPDWLARMTREPKRHATLTSTNGARHQAADAVPPRRKDPISVPATASALVVVPIAETAGGGPAARPPVEPKTEQQSRSTASVTVPRGVHVNSSGGVMTLRVFENGEYGDADHDRVPYRTVVVRPTVKSLESVLMAVTRDLGWNALGRRVAALYDTSGVAVADRTGLRDGMTVVATDGSPMRAIPPGSALALLDPNDGRPSGQHAKPSGATSLARPATRPAMTTAVRGAGPSGSAAAMHQQIRSLERKVGSTYK